MIRFLPNALTVLRIVLAPVFLYLAGFVQTPKALIWSWIIFIVAALTDWLDGYLARKLNLISDFGKIWDPLADKFIVLAALGVFTWASPFHLPWIIFAVIALREVLVTVMREVYARRKIFIAADLWGKLKTVLQMSGIIFFLAAWALGFTAYGLLLTCNLWFLLVAIVTILSGVNILSNKPTKLI
ncbi:MAG TPA: CDP-diacylglycerol--glycerol-3-phosphate 3-phosphatidyltransferase [Candidatus Cloacimonadota bacterium]|nr:CDP-diacylglycerol--glycerol-3-phosphate 3-phosphatidyltransferase [Candidatus Cloacimonadota bacterium]